MTMQDALSGAALRHEYARPSSVSGYVYRYVPQGRRGEIIEVSGRDRFGHFQHGYWRTITRAEIESDWIICDVNGKVLPEKSGLTLADL